MSSEEISIMNWTDIVFLCLKEQLFLMKKVKLQYTIKNKKYWKNTSIPETAGIFHRL